MKTRWFGSGLLACASLAALGCAAAYPGAPSAGDLAAHLTLPEDSGRQVRGQRADDGPVQLVQAQVGPPQVGVAQPQFGPSQFPSPQVTAQVGAQPAAPQAPPAAPASNLPPPIPPPIPLTPSTAVTIPSVPGSATGLPIPAAPGLTPTSMSSLRGNVPVLASVNGRPIFADEVKLYIQMTQPQILVERDPEKFKSGFKQVLDNMIDVEVAYQEAVRKLEKGNPKALEKLRDYVEEDFQKQTKPARKALPPEKFAEMAPTLRRQIERQLIGMEFVRAFVGPASQRISTHDIKDYYDAHPNEFQKISTIKWQHIFIAVNKEHPTIEQTLNLADGLLEHVRKGGDFLSLMKYDDGDAKTREGKGFGARKGEIRPAELEQYLFSTMKPGDAGLLPLSTGVHLFRLVERIDGGMTPFNDTVQTQIRNKMKSQILEREFKRFIRELKDRAVVEYVDGV